MGLAHELAPADLLVAVNTGDDFVHLGLCISPDLDTVMYTLAKRNNPELGWGLAGETWNVMEALEALGGETWFKLGDRDLATHIERTARLGAGENLSSVTRHLCRRYGVAHRIVPMSDDPVRTMVHTEEGTLAFQDYFVKRRCEPRITRFTFEGAGIARPSGELISLFNAAAIRGVVICPSNPFVSIAPILAIDAIREWLARRTVPVVAVSPIVGGKAIKGPAAKMFAELGMEPSAVAVAGHYRGLVDAWIIDEQDRGLGPIIEALGPRVHVTRTIMSSPEVGHALARTVVDVIRQTCARVS